MIYIRKDWCKGCELCIDHCPQKVLEMDLMVAKVTYEEKCIGCGICENICPDFAIQVRRQEDETIDINAGK